MENQAAELRHNAVLVDDQKTDVDTQGLKFLVVEDDFALQAVWEYIIKSISPQATIRWSFTEEGAEQLMRDYMKANDEFDFIICDVMLAGKRNGVDLWKRYGGGKSQFLFTSVLSRKEFQEIVGDEWEKYPYFIEKPLDPDRCMKSMKAMLSSRHKIPTHEH